jgi:hypothetical protein
METTEFRVSPINVANYGMHYFYGYGNTYEEAVADALTKAKERDPQAYAKDGRVFFSQPVYF